MTEPIRRTTTLDGAVESPPALVVGTLVTAEGHGSEVFTIEELWTDGESGEPCCYLSSDRVFGEEAALADLTVVMSAEKASARRLPTVQEFADDFNWLGTSWAQGFEIDGKDPAGDGQVRLVGSTAEGLRFTVAVHVLSIEAADS